LALVRIEITSTLTQEDEGRLAAAVGTALSGLLDMLPIAYLLRVETSERVLEHLGPVSMGHDGLAKLSGDASLPTIES
jgi:hypothetical protein